MNSPEEQNEVVAARAYPAPGASGETVAEAYIASELRDARKTLRRTQIISSLVALGVMGYIGFITANLQQALQPHAAAQIAQGIITERVEQHGPELIAEMERRIPALIGGLPDYALREMPAYREALEQRVEADMQRHFAAHSQELGETMDELLAANQEDIQRMLKTGQDEEATREIGMALEQEFTDYLKQTPAGNDESLMTKMDHSLSALQQVEKRMAHLANGKNLTPQERQARRAIALLSQSIEAKQKSS